MICMEGSVKTCFFPLWSLQLNYPDCFLFELIRSSVYATALLSSWRAQRHHLIFHHCRSIDDSVAEQLVGKEAFHLDSRMIVCVLQQSLLEPVVPCGQKGFGQFMIAKVRPIWSAVYVLGYPSSQRLLCWMRSQTLEITAFFPLLSAFQPTYNTGHVRNALFIWNRGRRTKEQLDWFFCSRCHTY